MPIGQWHRSAAVPHSVPIKMLPIATFPCWSNRTCQFICIPLQYMVIQRKENTFGNLLTKKQQTEEEEEEQMVPMLQSVMATSFLS